MPKAGTRKVEVCGEIKWLPEEEARLTELLREGCLIQARLEADKAKLDGIREKLAEIAEAKRGTRATLHLTSPEGISATVTWSRETTVEGAHAEALRKELGESWGEVFATKLSYTLAKGYKAFMRDPQGDLEKHKKAIAASINVIERKPSVKLHDIADGEKAA